LKAESEDTVVKSGRVEDAKAMVKPETDINDKRITALLDKDWILTAKTNELFKILKSIRDKDRTEKVVVFSEVYGVRGIADTVYVLLRLDPKTAAGKRL
jgi:hypothetical protein